MADRIARLRAMLEADPTDAFTRYALALEHAGQNDVGTAISILQELRTLQPDYVPTYHQLGIMFERTGNTEEAQVSYREGIAVATRTGDAHAAHEMQEALDLITE